MKLSIIIPSFNEVATIGRIIQQVKNQNFKNITKEIIVVNDGSTD
ncbi:glycosyltransferase, partial [Microgenomates group bacterium]|nr:glycosyltransferase [Microgenomates group bacterium]